MSTMPKRSKKFGVGKEMPGAIYIHKASIPSGELFDRISAAVKLSGLAWSEFDVIKVSLKNENVSFIRCEDFNGQDEPVISWVLTIGAKGPRYREYGDLVYHHKWLMVSDDYQGFDVEESKRRSERICATPGIDYSRCGKLSVWKGVLESSSIDAG